MGNMFLNKIGIEWENLLSPKRFKISLFLHRKLVSESSINAHDLPDYFL